MTEEKKKMPFITTAIIFFIALLFISTLAAVLIKKYVEHEATKAKTELVDKVKSVKNIDDTTAAKSVAKAIHKVTSFKDKVKSELKSLDSTDSIKK